MEIKSFEHAHRRSNYTQNEINVLERATGHVPPDEGAIQATAVRKPKPPGEEEKVGSRATALYEFIGPNPILTQFKMKNTN